jgi:hypothetical protein
VGLTVQRVRKGQRRFCKLVELRGVAKVWYKVVEQLVDELVFNTAVVGRRIDAVVALWRDGERGKGAIKGNLDRTAHLFSV